MISKFEWLQAGSCLSLDALTIKGGRFRVDSYPAGFALFHHSSQGWTLFDTGYSEQFFEATHHFPYRLYRWATPVRFQPEQSARAQIESRSLKVSDIKTIILSHLHADHIAGLVDFPEAKIICSQDGYENLSHLKGISAVRGGFLPKLMPNDFLERTQWIENKPDIWGDGSIKMIPMPGHAPGQYGAHLQTNTGEKLLCADTCWQSRSYRDLVDLPAFTHALLTHDTAAFRDSLQSLHFFSREHPQVKIYPSHCKEIY